MDRSESFSVGTLHAAIAGLSPFKAFMLSLVCGILTVFAFAPFYFWPVFILVISLLVWLVDGARTREKWGKAVFMRGWAYGIGFTLASMHWTAQPFLVNPEQHLAFIWMPLILLPAGLGLFFGLGTLLAGRFWSRTPARVFAFATALTFTELLRGTVFGGFPWNWSGMIWEPGSPVSQMASLFGLWGLSALTFLLAAAPAAMADYRREGSDFNRIFPLMVSAVIFASGWAWGTGRIMTNPTTEGAAVRIVDVEVRQDDKYPTDPEGRPVVTQQLRSQAATNVLRAYLIGTGDDFQDEPRLVVWPEAALPLPLLQDPNALDAVALRLGERSLIAGTARVDRYAEPQPEWYNSLAIIDARSRMRGANAIYDKNRLVPFGELSAADIIPFGHSISGILPGALQQMATAGFTPGPEGSPLELNDGRSFVPLICYEALFPGLVQRTLGEADFLVNISIDSWFGTGIGPEQHYSQARYRAIETGRPLVRAANLGYSGVVDVYGREVQSNISANMVEDLPVKVIDTIVPDYTVDTLFNQWSSYWTWLMLILMNMVTFFYYRISA